MKDFDFTFLDYKDVPTADVQIKTPRGMTGWTITIAGPEHPNRKRITFAKQRRMRALMSKTGKLPINDPEEEAAEELDLLMSCTLSWSGCPVPFSNDAMRALYSDPEYAYVREQVIAAMNERELFTRACSAA
jgi:hypothetical protein